MAASNITDMIAEAATTCSATTGNGMATDLGR
jgi:hypothetical protein